MKNIETENLVIRFPRMSDVDDFYAYAKRPTIGPLAGWLPHQSIEESKELLALFIENQDVYVLEERTTSKVIGTIGLHRTKTEPHVVSLGFVLDDCYWGRGLMSEAVNAVLKHIKYQTNIERVTCNHFSNNHRSKRVIEKMGFQFVEFKEEGYVRSDGATFDTLNYVLTLSEWKEDNYVKNN